MPQGGLHPGETPQQAALRELCEELGTTKAEFIDVFPGWTRYDYPSAAISARARMFRGQQHRWFLMRFTGDDSDITVATAHPEFTTWRWMAPADLLQSVVPFKRPCYSRVLAYFAPAIGPQGGCRGGSDLKRPSALIDTSILQRP